MSKTTDTSDSLITLTIPEERDGQRLDYALADMAELSRSRIQSLLKTEHIRSAATPILKASQKVMQGERFTIELPPTQPLAVEAEDIPLDILYEDEHLIIINKPVHMVVHPSHGHDHGTLVHALLHHCTHLPGINGVERPGIVHRLDKGTSGSLVVAKTEACHLGLSALFANHTIDRQYIAWSRGNVSWRHTRVDLPIGRHPQHRQKMAIHAHGKPAITDVQIEKMYQQMFCRSRLTLHTGRTHQIRVHLAHHQLPILGDETYGRRFNPGKHIPDMVAQAILNLDHQALHAEVLGFCHPITQEDIHVKAPWPDDLQQLHQALEQSY